MYFVAVKFPAFRISSWMFRRLAELLQECLTIRFTCKKLEVLAHQLIDALTHGISTLACRLKGFIIYG